MKTYYRWPYTIGKASVLTCAESKSIAQSKSSVNVRDKNDDNDGVDKILAWYLTCNNDLISDERYLSYYLF